VSDIPIVEPASAHDIDIMARTIYGEARSETWLAQEQVGLVILNRVRMDLHNDGKPDWWGEGIAAVCLKPYQFSCWLPGDPNLPKLKAATLDDHAFQVAMAAALQCILGLAFGVVNDNKITHYYVVGSPMPKWAVGRQHEFIVGKHAFFKDIP
jgi:N-acetylmuramoyl-L-alanine amidase